MAKKVKIPTKFNTSVRVVGFASTVAVSDGKIVGRWFDSAPILWPSANSSDQGIRIGTVQWKDGVADSFDAKTDRMWTITLQVTPRLTELLTAMDGTSRIKTSTFGLEFEGNSSRYGFMILMPTEATRPLGFDDGDLNHLQFVHAFAKRISKKTVVIQGRGLPLPGVTPIWSQVRKF